jgi:hypothetical protein
LFRRVKKCFPERIDGWYVGPYARGWADETGGRFRPYHTRSIDESSS